MDQTEQEEGERIGEKEAGRAGTDGQRFPSRVYRACVVTATAHVSHSKKCLGDLEGLKVSHDFDTLDEGEARILTLKDSRILDNEGVTASLQPDCKALTCL